MPLLSFAFHLEDGNGNRKTAERKSSCRYGPGWQARRTKPENFRFCCQGEFVTGSDIDLLVKMEEGRSLLDLTALTLDLQELLGLKVDVVSEDGLYWLLRRRILKEARPL